MASSTSLQSSYPWTTTPFIANAPMGGFPTSELVKPDVLVMQGLDAGGHGWEKGAGVISLVPEAVDALEENGFAHIHVLAAGGIVDGRGVAAALALGAEGVVMGTRFLGALETT